MAINVQVEHLWWLKSNFSCAWVAVKIQKAHVFLCLRNCRNDSNHFIVKEWSPRVEHV